MARENTTERTMNGGDTGSDDAQPGEHGGVEPEYQYGGPSIGVYDTRHEAVGKAAIAGKDYGKYLASRIGEPGHVTACVLEYTNRVHVVPYDWCSFCGREFHAPGAYSNHLPCEPARQEMEALRSDRASRDDAKCEQ